MQQLGILLCDMVEVGIRKLLQEQRSDVLPLAVGRQGLPYAKDDSTVVPTQTHTTHMNL
jgi:hypothetical protein